ncbi:FimB/Mfa2 family fimbrial subunit [Bacteroides sp. 519]|uniref:FimB/Mfa2 family fimbrial subunit n=1 Tax=Bacteroides sp. 519 TaxID=2302937 RepID=UPI0013D68971|nr:FimB/Mfa2 family fimbrial subunit [Bacteroides sp. 519]NDV58280.1 hypothetical protein [Bacteroides sp. 519]
MMKLFTRTYLPALLLLSALLAGCIKEDLSGCLAGLQIYFSYTPETYTRGYINETEVKRIDLFVFDAEEILRGVYVDKNPTLSLNYCIAIDNLPAGDYNFVAWCGVPTHYKFIPQQFVIGQTKLADALLYLEHENEVTNGVLPLFYAGKTEFVTNADEQKIYLPLNKAYNTINLTTEGLPLNNNDYQLLVYDNNSIYDFDYSFVDNDNEFAYTTQCQKDPNGQLLASLNILKLAAHRSPIIKIKNQTTNTLLYSENLVTLINEIKNIDYNNTHVFNIHLRFMGPNVSVYINGWWVVDDEIGLI